MIQLLKRLMGDESGPTSIEYALIVSGIAAVVVGAVLLFGSSIRNSLETSTKNLTP